MTYKHGETFTELELQDEEGNTLVVPGWSRRDTEEERKVKMDKAAAEYEAESGKSTSIVLMTRRYLEFGLQPPASAPAAWGARGNGTRGGFDVYPDRHCTWGSKKDQDRIFQMVNAGVLKAARKKWLDLRDLGVVASYIHKQVVLYEDDEIIVRANSNGSGYPKYGDPGYVYLVAYFKDNENNNETDGENR